MLRYLKVHIQNRKKKWSTAETAADHFALHGSSLALTFYSPFCRGDTLIYMDLCEPKSFEFLKTWRYMDIYEDTLPMGAPSIPNFIYLHSPLFSRKKVAEWRFNLAIFRTFFNYKLFDG